jgi:hypothetical protein
VPESKQKQATQKSTTIVVTTGKVPNIILYFLPEEKQIFVEANTRQYSNWNFDKYLSIKHYI